METHQNLVLFYKYFVSPCPQPTKSEVEGLQSFLRNVCKDHALKGRILLSEEGVNGTLSAKDQTLLNDFCRRVEETHHLLGDIDWKFSLNESHKEPFPDLKIAIVREIVSTGNTVAVNEIPKFGGNHLTPEKFHQALEEDGDKETVVIDVRNTFEYNIGHFVPPEKNGQRLTVMNPEMVTFSQFSNFCDKNVEFLKDKKVLMYCTGGIRCEKASAMLVKRGISDVSQLNGGIHRYMETYGANGYFKGKNFVFDQRIALNASGDTQIVGKCLYCTEPYDELSGDRICTVCRDLVLICENCRRGLREYHCELHSGWKKAYFTFLDVFDHTELLNQKNGLQTLLDESTSRNTKRTLRKQIEKVEERLAELNDGKVEVNPAAPLRCRTCREPSTICDGLCWGFWKATQGDNDAGFFKVTRPTIEVGDSVKPGPDWNSVRLGDATRVRDGKVVQVKSWAGEARDCVSVLWDSFSGTRTSPEIYRYGVISKDGVPKYDVVKVTQLP